MRWLAVLALLLPQMASASTLDEAVNAAFEPIVAFCAKILFFGIPLGGAEMPLIVLWLVAGAVFFTAYLRLLPLRHFRTAIDLVRGRYDDPNDPGEVSHFQALATALSGTVGLGNIAGVAVAVTKGGPGATFWMILAGLLGMSSKLAECTLAVKYRDMHADGSVSGGPMYYLERGLRGLGLPFGKPLAKVYAATLILGCFGGGNMFQSNQAFEQVLAVTGGEASFLYGRGWLFGLLLAAGVAVVIIGGIKSIARVTERLVPGMALIYLLTGGVVLLMNLGRIPHAIGQILQGAFTPDGVTGGAIGVLIVGFQRAAFSNEAGLGSAAIAHAAVRTDEAATEGLVSMLEPFIDTVVICTMTALVIGVTMENPGASGLSGIALTSKAFASAFSFAPYLLALAAFLFAYSTAISWSYYGLKGWTYLFGEGAKKELLFKVVFCAFTVLGAMISLSAVIDFSDMMILSLALFNLLGLYFLAPQVRDEVESFLGHLASGKVARRW